MARALHDLFFNWLKDKDNQRLLDTLAEYDCLAIHFSEGKALKIYFKGFLILTISDKMVDNSATPFKILDKAYLKTGDTTHLLSIIKNGVTITNLQKYLDAVIGFLSRRDNSRVEESIRQEIARINNRSSVANDTDYFVISEEYKIKNSKFDLVTIKWRSKSNERKFNPQKTPLEITIFELKQGLNAVGGRESDVQKADLKKHYSDFQALVSDTNGLKEFKLDIVKMFFQQASLKGFFNDKIEGLKHVRKVSDTDVEKIAEKIPVKFGMILSDYKQESDRLKEQIEMIPEDADFLFARSSFMGYGLYENSLLSRKQLLKIL